jgi:hypothetical protein
MFSAEGDSLKPGVLSAAKSSIALSLKATEVKRILV